MLSEGAVQLRAATAHDAAAVEDLLYSTGPSSFRWVFGLGDERRARALVLRAFAHPRGPLSHRFAVVAVSGAAVCGVALGFPASRKAAIERSFAPFLITTYPPWEWPRVIRRGLQADRFLRGVPPGSWYLNMIAVAQAVQGRGVARDLLNHVIGEARQSRLSAVMLHVAYDNPRAQAFYTRAGFRVLAELRDPQLEEATGLKGQLAMALSLDAATK